jgi:hypothetical protein
MSVPASARGNRGELCPLFPLQAAFLLRDGPTQASFRAEPTARLTESAKSRRNHPAVARKGAPYGASRLKSKMSNRTVA